VNNDTGCPFGHKVRPISQQVSAFQVPDKTKVPKSMSCSSSSKTSTDYRFFHVLNTVRSLQNPTGQVATGERSSIHKGLQKIDYALVQNRPGTWTHTNNCHHLYHTNKVPSRRPMEVQRRLTGEKILGQRVHAESTKAEMFEADQRNLNIKLSYNENYLLLCSLICLTQYPLHGCRTI
jgi:hypothetical protein